MSRSGPLRVLFLTLYPDVAASPRYRVTQFLPYLEAHGVECTVHCPLTGPEFATLTGPGRTRRPFHYHAKETPRRIRQILGACSYDIVFLQKAILTAYLRGMPALLRTCARRLVYDLDDAVHLAPPHPLRRVWRLLEDRGQVNKILAAADLVLAGNGWLAEAARDCGGPVALFPTVVDTDRFAPAPDPPIEYRVGWMGNPSTTSCLAPAASALETLEDGELVLVGADTGQTVVRKAIIRPWSLASEVEELQHFAVGIMPLPEADWHKGKCALKALQYMACGIPCVASPVGPARDIIVHNENGLLAETPAQWRDAFEQLRDPVLRQTLGAAGRATVEKQFSLRQAAPRLLELLESIA